MAAPTLEDLKEYLAPTGHNWTDPQLTKAMASEKGAQASVCRVPADADTWPPDLAEALFRRVAHNLALRSLPLGVSTAVTDMAVATNKVGGSDAEVKRLERPFRKLVVG